MIVENKNPVTIKFGPNTLKEIDGLIGNRRALLLSSPGAEKRGMTAQLRSMTSKIEGVYARVMPLPDFESLEILYAEVRKTPAEVLVAMGGGSVIDAAKVVSAVSEPAGFGAVAKIIRGEKGPEGLRRIPVIAVPTTAGTGSEVTPWATVWDKTQKIKYSLHAETLFPESCLCDPVLTLSMTRELTIQTALDALSHCFEAIWNKNANPFSADLAKKAAKRIMTVLPWVIQDLSHLSFREKMMRASLEAGLASSTTQTALAHAISYYLTLHRDVPHGIACSFCLPGILDAVIGSDAAVDEAIRDILGEVNSRPLRRLYEKLGVATRIRDYGIQKEELTAVTESLVKTQRARNFLFQDKIQTIVKNL